MKNIATISLKKTVTTTVLMTILLAVVSAMPALGDDKNSAATPRSLTIPAGAVEAGQATWKYTDTDGKKWIYRKSPFGVVRVEDTPEADKPAVAGADERTKRWKVTEQGDKVTFENASPFGPQRWTKKKSELTDDEKAALSRAQRDPLAAKPAKAEGKD